MTLLKSCLDRGILPFLTSPLQCLFFWRRVLRAAANEIRRPLPLQAHRWIIDPYKEYPGLEKESVRLEALSFSYGEMSVDELLVLMRFVKYRKPKKIFEIGTYLGGTTLQLAANSDAQVFTLDLPLEGQKSSAGKEGHTDWLDVKPEQVGMRFLYSEYQSRIVQLEGDSREFDFSPWYNQIDIVFIDACHHYEFVFSDTIEAHRMLKPGGVIIWHDCATYAPGVIKTVEQFSKFSPVKIIINTTLAYAVVDEPGLVLKRFNM